MAKRFTDTELYDRANFRRLPPRLKCAWDWLCKRCDKIGVWQIDMDRLSFEVGEPVTLAELTESFQVQVLDEDKLFIPGFVPFQYGDEGGLLSRKSPVHKDISKKLEARGFPKPAFKEETPTPVGEDTQELPSAEGLIRRRIRISSSSVSSSEKEELPPIPTEHLAECILAWGKTLTKHGIRKDPKLDEMAIMRLIRLHGYEKTRLALTGAGFEESRPGYNASKHVRISRFDKPSNFDAFVNLGAQNAAQERRIYDPEKPAC